MAISKKLHGNGKVYIRVQPTDEGERHCDGRSEVSCYGDCAIIVLVLTRKNCEERKSRRSEIGRQICSRILVQGDRCDVTCKSPQRVRWALDGGAPVAQLAAYPGENPGQASGEMEWANHGVCAQR